MHYNRKVTLIIEVDRKFHNGAIVKGEAKVVFQNGGVLVSESDIPENADIKKELRRVLTEAAPLMEWMKFAMGGSE